MNKYMLMIVSIVFYFNQAQGYSDKLLGPVYINNKISIVFDDIEIEACIAGMQTIDLRTEKSYFLYC